MDIRRNNPASPRGRQGKSYHDLTAMRAASVPPTPGLESPKDGQGGYMALPTADDESAPKLTMRKTHAEEEIKGLELDKGDVSGSGSGSGTGHEREKSD